MRAVFYVQPSQRPHQAALQLVSVEYPTAACRSQTHNGRLQGRTMRTLRLQPLLELAVLSPPRHERKELHVCGRAQSKLASDHTRTRQMRLALPQLSRRGACGRCGSSASRSQCTLIDVMSSWDITIVRP